MDSNTIIEGTVKFRDGKKWKSRWCVMRKLSPVADCLHLQLYRDSKDRYKQGQTKASLSLQHFLGVETGFTLDKESNTVAIICQDVTVILAFDTRERLIQWQVKISNNLGDDQQYLVQITSAPPKAKLATGPARLHIMDQRFCITTGVPPRLAGYWEIAHLRRYGVVEGRFCFEGGSRCGRGEGLHVCACDRAEEVAATVRLAADGRLALRRRPLARKMSALESPRRQPARPDTRASDVSCATALLLASESSMDPCPEDLLCPCRLQAGGGGSPFWSSAESAAGQLTELDCNYGCGDTTSVRDLRRPPSSLAGDAWGCEVSRPGGGSALPPPLERCASCISKLGAPALSRSSTATAPDTPSAATPFSPAWTMDGGPSPQASLGQCMCAAASAARAPSSCGRASVASLSSGSGSGSGSGGASEYCVPRLCAAPDLWYDRPRPVSSTGVGGPPHLSPHSPPSVPPKSPKPGAGPGGLPMTPTAANTGAAPCPCCPPTRPPKPPQMSTPGSATDSPSKKKPRKPPMPLPLPAAAATPASGGAPTPHPQCHCPHYPGGVVLQQPLQQARLDACSVAGPYDNYDVPKPLVGPQVFHKDQVPNQQVEYYDTPKKLKDSLSSSMNESMFGNYDTPPVVKTVRKSCGCVIKYTTKKSVVTTSQMDSSKLSEHEDTGVSAATHCPCQRVMYWAENWMMLPYCRRGNGMENTSVPIHKVKLSGEGKMPVVNASGEIAIYATVDKNKKTSRRLAASEQQDGGCSCPAEVKENPDHAQTCPKPDTSNYVNVEATPGASSPSGNQDTRDSNQDGVQTNYENIDFAQSLEYYENARDVLQRAGVTQQEVEALANELDEARAEAEDMSYLQTSGFKFCNKCGHACHIPRAMTSQPLSSAATPDGPPEPTSASGASESISGAAMVTSENTDVPSNKQDDYLMMEPGKHLPNQGNKNFPGYLPMSPITNPNAGYNKLRIDQGLPAEKSASIPSLAGPMVDRSRKRSESEFPRVPGSAMMMMHHSANSPYLRRLLMDTADDTRRTQLLARKRSSSADSSRYLDGSTENFDSDVIERPISSSQTKLINPDASTSGPLGTSSSCTLSEQESVIQRPEVAVEAAATAPVASMTSSTVTSTPEATTLSSSITDVTVPSSSTSEVVASAVTEVPAPSSETTTTATAMVTTVVTATTTSPVSVATTTTTVTTATAPVAVAEETDTGSTSSGSPRSQPREMIVTNAVHNAATQPHETLSPSSVHIRRSSSVPCKGNNRDSSSSNDSGVSTGSLRHRGADFAEFELPLTTATSARRHAHALLTGGLGGSRHPGALCLHASLPRRSKSVDPLRELSFQFQKIKVPAKSSSAEAEVPICPGKRDGTKGFQSPGGEGAAVVAYMDSRSTSSGTSDMSDYIETLSLSSHSSSDTPDSLRLGRPATTTLRPRSGKEYQLIDRSILEGDLKSHASGPANIEKGGHHLRGLVPPYTSFTPVPEKAESPSPGYMSASPGQEREDQPLIAHAYPK